MKSKDILKGVGTLLAVGVVGAGAGLLFAPQSGDKTRRMIRRKTEDLGVEVRDLYGNIVEKSDGAARRVRHIFRMRIPVRDAVERSIS
jgi:gas vesicle protein